MHTAVQHLFTGRSDLRFLASSYHHTEIIREVIERIRVDSPSLATTLQPLATSNDSFRVTVIKQMIDLGAVRRLGSPFKVGNTPDCQYFKQKRIEEIHKNAGVESGWGTGRQGQSGESRMGILVRIF